MILAIDSSVGTAVAVTDATGVERAAGSSADRRSHAESIVPLIAHALADANITAADVTAVVMGVGPGPFTGLRVGMAAAEAFAWGREIPVWAVRSHDTLCVDIESDTLAVSDARRGEWACTRYTPHPEGGPALVSSETFLMPRAELAPDTTERDGARVVFVEEVSPAVLATVAVSRQARGETLLDPRPLYLRQPDVTMPQ